MNKEKIIKRPLSIKLIITAYIIVPLSHAVLFYINYKGENSNILMEYYNVYQFTAIWLLTAPIAGICLYFIKKWCWYLFIIHSSLLLIDFVFTLFQDPSSYKVFLMSGNLFIIGLVLYVVQKNFRAPYFQVIKRGWRIDRRYLINEKVMIDGKESRIDDLSTSGCFLINNNLYLNINQEINIKFLSPDLGFSISGEIVRTSNSGYGIRFNPINKDQKTAIQKFLH